MNNNRLLVIVGIALLASAVGLVGYVGNRSADRLLRDAFAQFENAESFYAAATVATFAPDEAVRAAGGDPETTFLPLVFVGEGSMRMPKGVQPSGTASFVLTTGQDESNQTAADVMLLPEGASYVRISSVPATDPTALAPLAGKWFSFPERNGAASLAAWERFRAALATGEIYAGRVMNEGVVALGDVQARKFSVGLRPEALGAFSEDAAVLFHGRPLTSEERAELAVVAPRTGVLEVWVDVKTRRIAQASLNLRGINGLPDDTGKVSGSYLNVLLRFTGWNEPVEIVAPAASEPLPDVLRQLTAPGKGTE